MAAAEKVEAHKEAWRQTIYDVTGDAVKAERAIALAELNGLFDLHKSLFAAMDVAVRHNG